MGAEQPLSSDRQETPEEAAAAILAALKYLAGEAEHAGLAQLAGAIDSVVGTAATAIIRPHDEPS